MSTVKMTAKQIIPRLEGAIADNAERIAHWRVVRDAQPEDTTAQWEFWQAYERQGELNRIGRLIERGFKNFDLSLGAASLLTSMPTKEALWE